MRRKAPRPAARGPLGKLGSRNGLNQSGKSAVNKQRFGVRASKRTQDRAARKLQGMFRTRQARRRLRILVRSVYERIYDEHTGAYYFHNVHTGEVSWEAPKILGNENFNEIQDKLLSPHEQLAIYRHLARHWVRTLDDDTGHEYFYNTLTQEATWTKPVELEKVDDATFERNEMLGEDWIEVKDENGNYYFYNQVTKEAEWTPPDVDFRKSDKEKKREAKEARREARRKRREMGLSSSSVPHSLGQPSASRKQLETATTALDLIQFDGSESESDSSLNSDSANSQSGGDDESEPPDGEVVDHLLVAEQKATGAATASSDDDSVYISSSEEEDIDEQFETNEGHAVKEEDQEGKEEGEEGMEAAAQRDGKETERDSENGDPEARAGLQKEQQSGKPWRKPKTKRHVLRRIAQKQRHLANLAALENESLVSRLAYEARVRMKRYRKRRHKTLELCELELSKVPGEVFGPRLSKTLTCLDMGLNRLRSIPIKIKLLQGNLRRLILESNMLTSLPMALLYCRRLNELDVRNNRISSLPREKGNIEVLRDLDAWEIGIETLQELEVLRLDSNTMEQLEPEIEKLKLLQHLSVRGNRLITLPEEGLRGLVSLVHLDLSHNRLEVLPQESFKGLDKLSFLSLAGNKLHYLPGNTFASLKSLRVFDVSCNELLEVPDDLVELRVIESLILDQNELTRFPDGWKSEIHTKLRVIKLSRNRLPYLPDSFANLEALEHLDVSFNGIRQHLVGVDMSRMVKLKTIKASQNLLGHLPLGVGNLPCLVEMDLSFNALKEIHIDDIFGAPALAKVALSHNNLISLHDPAKTATSGAGSSFEVARCGLRTLDLSYNELERLPTTLFTRTSLQVLNCEHNQLMVIPPSVEEAHATLEHFILSHNHISSLPSSLQSLTRLRSIPLDHNDIRKRPALLAKMVNLQNVQLDFNPIEYPRDDIAVWRAALNEANLLISKRSLEEGVKKLCALLEDIESKKGPTVLIEEVLSNRGAAYLSQENYESAIEDLNRVLLLRDQPGCQVLYNRAAARFRGLGDATGALLDLDEALRINETYLPAFRLRAACLIALGHYDKAIDDTTFVLESEPDDGEALLQRGIALEKKGNISEALVVYERIVELYPTQDEAGDGSKKEKTDENASENKEEEKEEMNKLSPWAPVGLALYRAGLIYRDLGDAAKAIVRFEEASGVLYGQTARARYGSARQKVLNELLRLSIMCKSSALQSMGRDKKAMDAYIEAQELAHADAS